MSSSDERVGNLTVIQKDSATSAAVQSRLTLLVRFMYSNPPAFGGRIVGKILNCPDLRNEWMNCIQTMSSRIIKMRKLLRDELERLETPGTWAHITNQIGMFSYTGLTRKLNFERVKINLKKFKNIFCSILAAQVKHLIGKYHIYLLSSGRINMCGLNEKNVAYVAKAINDAVVSIKE